VYSFVRSKGKRGGGEEEQKKKEQKIQIKTQKT